jgi:hypothetical protein
VSFPSEGIQRVDGKIEDSLHTAITMTLSPDGKWMWDGSNWIPAPPQEAPEELIEQPVVETQPEPTAVLPTGFPPAGLPPTSISTPSIIKDSELKHFKKNGASYEWVMNFQLEEKRQMLTQIVNHLDNDWKIAPIGTIAVSGGLAIIIERNSVKVMGRAVVNWYDFLFLPLVLFIAPIWNLLLQRKHFNQNEVEAKRICFGIEGLLEDVHIPSTDSSLSSTSSEKEGFFVRLRRFLIGM